MPDNWSGKDSGSGSRIYTTLFIFNWTMLWGKTKVATIISAKQDIYILPSLCSIQAPILYLFRINTNINTLHKNKHRILLHHCTCEFSDFCILGMKIKKTWLRFVFFKMLTTQGSRFQGFGPNVMESERSFINVFVSTVQTYDSWSLYSSRTVKKPRYFFSFLIRVELE